MKCPVCKDVDLVMSERQGVEIDYCPSCRGVWLDRGELDKIIEKSSSFTKENPYKPNYQSHSKPNYQESSHHQNYSKPNYHHDSHNGYPKKKKENFLSDLFDFEF